MWKDEVLYDENIENYLRIINVIIYNLLAEWRLIYVFYTDFKIWEDSSITSGININRIKQYTIIRHLIELLSITNHI